MTESSGNVVLYGYMRRGINRSLLYLKNNIELIEAKESNGARRYRLLKAIIEMGQENPNYLLDHGGEPFKIKYKFEKDDLIINDNKKI